MGGHDMIMGHWSIWHWLLLAIFAALVVYPLGRILIRLGFSPFWSVIAFIPFANLVGLWAIAFMAWPREKRDAP